MPIYEYRCTACGAKEEHIQKLSDPPPPGCASCGGRLEKQMTAAAFHLKGGGWYADGYASPRPGTQGGDGSRDSAGKSAGANEPPGGGNVDKPSTKGQKEALAS